MGGYYCRHPLVPSWLQLWSQTKQCLSYHLVQELEVAQPEPLETDDPGKEKTLWHEIKIFFWTNLDLCIYVYIRIYVYLYIYLYLSNYKIYIYIHSCLQTFWALDIYQYIHIYQVHCGKGRKFTSRQTNLDKHVISLIYWAYLPVATCW